MPTTPAKFMTTEDRSNAWRAPLTAVIGALLLFEVVTGFIIWLAPLTLTTQFMLLAHTVLGVLMIVPYVWYQVRHWLKVRQQRFSHHKVTGYGSLVALALCIVSGVVLTVQATMETRISYAMDAIHIGSSIALVVLLGVHLVTVIQQDQRRNATAAAILRTARRRFGFASLIIAVCFGLLTGAWQASYDHPSLEWELPADYGYSYGKDTPFAPSLATTSTGGAVHPRRLSGSKSCGQSGCHQQIYDEWVPSAHRYASIDVAFQAVQKVMAENEGPESTRYCAGCHDPVALFSGSKNIYDEDLSSPGAEEGVSCIACHSLVQTDLQGNASYTIEPPDFYAYELDESATGRFMSGFLIRALPRHHATQYAPSILKSPEYCAACHKQFIDEEINDFGWVQLQNQYDNWRKSHWNREGDPAESDFCNTCHERKGVATDVTGRCTAITTSCRECHMRLLPSTDPGAGDPWDLARAPDDGLHRSHRFIGANQFMPAVLGLKGHEEQVRRTHEWLRGETAIPEIAHKWPSVSKAYLESSDRKPTPSDRLSGPVLPIRLQAEVEKAKAGEDIRFSVEILNRKVGHDFPTGPLDVIQCWVETEVLDAEGNVLYHSGRLQPDGFVEPGSFVFKAEGVDAQGNLIDRHNLWELVGARFKRSLFPGFTDTARFEFTCPDQLAPKKTVPGGGEHTFHAPAKVKGPLTIKARLLYRKVNQHLLNIVTGSKDVRAPVTEIDTDELTLPLATP